MLTRLPWTAPSQRRKTWTVVWPLESCASFGYKVSTSLCFLLRNSCYTNNTYKIVTLSPLTIDGMGVASIADETSGTAWAFRICLAWTLLFFSFLFFSFLFFFFFFLEAKSTSMGFRSIWSKNFLLIENQLSLWKILSLVVCVHLVWRFEQRIKNQLRWGTVVAWQLCNRSLSGRWTQQACMDSSLILYE